MSDVYSKITGWVGYGDGADVLLSEGQPVDSEHPVVRDRPELFTLPERTRPPARRSGPVT